MIEKGQRNKTICAGSGTGSGTTIKYTVVAMRKFKNAVKEINCYGSGPSSEFYGE